MCPSLSTVARFVDPVSDREIRTLKAFAARDVKNVGVRGSNCYRADRLRRLVVENGSPCAAIVVGSPYPSVDSAHVEDIRLAGHAGYSSRPAAPERPDHAPGHVLIQTRRVLLSSC